MANPSTGRFTWHELMTSDAVAATKFYTALLGWTVQEMDAGPMGTYRLLKQGDVTVGGAMAAPPGVPSHWLVYVGVEDTDVSARKIAELGGKVLVPPTTVPDMLRFACAMDPTGAAFGILTGIGPSANTPPYDGPARVGTFCWDELNTRDAEGAKKFYASLFGWTGKGGDGAMQYWHWRSGDKDIGGMMDVMGGPQVPSHWLGYLAVSDVDATTKKAEALGGKVLMPAMEIPKVGKFSVVQDPTGAAFAPFRSARV
jgi:predicted enzyme related to lactoylglutathione lyase